MFPVTSVIIIRFRIFESTNGQNNFESFDLKRQKMIKTKQFSLIGKKNVANEDQKKNFNKVKIKDTTYLREVVDQRYLCVISNDST